MQGDHGVFGGGDELAAQVGGAVLAGDGGEDGEGGLLDLATEDAAAHQPGVDCGGAGCLAVGREVENDDGDDAVIAEAVGEAELEADDGGVVEHRADVGFQVAAGGEVELIGLVDELGDARDAGGVEWGPEEPHVEAAKVGWHVGRGGSERSAGCVGLVLGAAGAVFIGEGEGFEVAGVCDALRHQGGFFGQFGDGDHG